MGHAVEVLELVVVQDQLLQVDEGHQRCEVADGMKYDVREIIV